MDATVPRREQTDAHWESRCLTVFVEEREGPGLVRELKARDRRGEKEASRKELFCEGS